MKEILKEPLTYIAVYFFMMIFTFGHAYNSVPSEEKSSFANIPYTIHNGGGVKTLVGVASGIFWPLYWSVKIQEKT